MNITYYTNNVIISYCAVCIDGWDLGPSGSNGVPIAIQVGECEFDYWALVSLDKLDVQAIGATALQVVTAVL